MKDCACDKRTLRVTAKCSDMCVVEYGGQEHDGYVPSKIGIGSGDYIEMDVCMDCGKIQSKDFPVAREALAEVFDPQDGD